MLHKWTEGGEGRGARGGDASRFYLSHSRVAIYQVPDIIILFFSFRTFDRWGFRVCHYFLFCVCVCVCVLGAKLQATPRTNYVCTVRTTFMLLLRSTISTDNRLRIFRDC